MSQVNAHAKYKRQRRPSYKSECRKRLSEREIEEFRETFDLFDENRDGRITEDELRTCVLCFGLEYDDDEMDSFICEYDTDGNGVVDFEEYLDVVGDKSRQPDAMTPGEIETAFKCFDRNGDGVLDARELRQSMATLGVKMKERELCEMMVAADKNGDGKINYREFTKVMFSLEKKK